MTNLHFSAKVHNPIPTKYFYYTSIFGVEFSPNDSLLYAMVLDQDFRYNQLWQYNLYPDVGEPNLYRLPYPKANSPMVIVDDNRPISSNLKLGPNGKIYLNSFISRLNTLSYIQYPDKLGTDCKIVYDAIQNPWGTFPDDLSGNFHLGYTHDHYKPVKFRHSSPCAGQFAQFENLTDSQNFSRYRFYFGDGDSCELDESLKLTILGQRNMALSKVWGVGHQYVLPGQYFVKLKAINNVGGYVWYSDSITIHPPPVAGFTVSDTAGCQWIAHHFNNTSSFKPRFSGPPPSAYSYHWQFGNGLDTSLSFAAIPTAAQGSVSHAYIQNGLYRVSLVANDGFCSDTFTLNQQVNILPAPRPGISLNPSAIGCSPLAITASRSYTDPIDSVRWQWGDGTATMVITNPGSAPKTYDHILPQTQNYILVQELFGPTGCITTDTQTIRVKPGFEHGYIPTLWKASVENENTKIAWSAHPHAKGYQLYKDNVQLSTLVDTFYLDELNSQKVGIYHIQAINVCDQPTPISNIGKVVLLQGENKENKGALLQWTAYEDWQELGGIATYVVEVQKSGVYEPLKNTETLNYNDAQFIQNGQYERCYRIAAINGHNPDLISYSNTACVGYEAVIFVPNAFSPNGDGLNDQFEPFNIGFKEYTMRIYNRWGEKISEGKQWDGKIQGESVPPGVYWFQIEGKTGKSENVHLRGDIRVVR